MLPRPTPSSRRAPRQRLRRSVAAVAAAALAGLGLAGVGLVATAPAASAAAPVLRVTPSALDFGDVQLGTTSAAQSVTVVNDGTTSATLSGSNPAGAPFAVRGGCRDAVLAPGAKCTLSVTFTPTSLGRASKTLTGNYGGTAVSLAARGIGYGQFSISPTSFDFGDAALGSTSPRQQVTVTNRGSSAVVMSGAGGGAGRFGGSQDCQGTTLAPGASCHMSYAFTPDALGAATGSTSGSWNGQPFSLSFRGNGVRQFSISPTSFDFGDVPVGSTSATQQVTVTNRGSSPVTMSGAGGGAGKFGGSQNCQGSTLDPGESCHMSYAFSPDSLGAATGSTSGTWNGQPFSLSFTGYGVRQLSISPRSMDFGEVPVGTTSPAQEVTITNLGTSPVTMSGAGGGAGQFGGSQDCQGRTLAPGASCHMFYAFTPSAAGAVTGSTSGTWNGQPFAMTFKGTGITGARTQTFRISPTSLDFGDVPIGGPSPEQVVTITNVSGSPVVMSGAGGGAGQFGGVQDCQGGTLAPGASCHLWYAFTPSAVGATTGSTSGTWNGQPFSMSFTGTGRPQFTISPTAFDFGDTVIGSPEQQQVTITNRASSSVVMSGAGGGAGQFGGVQDCQGDTLSPAESCHMWYAFSPTATGAATGSTSGTWNGQDFRMSFSGNGRPRLLISPTRFDFGAVVTGGTTPEQQVEVTNRGATPVTGSGTGGGAVQFPGAQDCQGTVLGAGESCHSWYRFSPTGVGVVTENPGGTWNGQPASVSLTGIALRKLLVSPTGLAFGKVQVGTTSASQRVTVRNVSGGPVTLAVSGGGAANVGKSTSCLNGSTLAAGATCQFSYTFKPTAAGAVTRTPTPVINGISYPIAVTGTGS